MKKYTLLLLSISLLACNPKTDIGQYTTSEKLEISQEQDSIIKDYLIEISKENDLTVKKIDLLEKLPITRHNVDSIRFNLGLAQVFFGDVKHTKHQPTDSIIKQFNDLFNIKFLTQQDTALLGNIFLLKVQLDFNEETQEEYFPIILDANNRIPTNLKDFLKAKD
ncbi:MULTISPECIES: hypothetical protein [unclassified Myroides]|uniref:hypothetical protein n=1 Tax=unclassified Myroides TaxID=2642485 RepID=UPI003D2F86FB